MASQEESGTGNGFSVSRPTVRHIYTLAVAAGLLVLIYMARSALAPYVLALLGIYILLPLVRLIEDQIPDEGRWKRWRRPLAVLATILVTLIALTIVLSVLIAPVVDQTTELIENLDDYWDSINSEYPQYVTWYEENIPEALRTRIEDALRQAGDALVPGFAGILSWLVDVTGSLISVVISIVAIPLFIVYYLLEEPNTKQNFRRAIPGRWTEDAFAAFSIFDQILGSYTRGVMLMAVIVGIITGLGYWVIGVDLWLPLAFIAFAGEIVPLIGPWIAFGISFPVILATEPGLAIPAAILFLLIQALEGWFLAPRIEGRAVDFTSAGTLLLLSVGGALAGGLGVVFVLPAAAILRALITYGSLRLEGRSPREALGELPIFQDNDAQPAIEPAE